MHSLTGGVTDVGRMAKDSSDNIYWGMFWKADPGTCVAKLDLDENIEFDFLNWPKDTYDFALSLILSADDEYLYVLTDSPAEITKFELSTGDVVWNAAYPFGQALGGYQHLTGFEFTIDNSNNCYGTLRGPNNGKPIVQFDADTGAVNYIYTDTGQIPSASPARTITKYDIITDNDLEIVISGGKQACFTTSFEDLDNLGYMNNLWVRTFDNTAGDKVRVKGTYTATTTTHTYLIGTGCIAVYDGYIYVLIPSTSGNGEVYKYQWNGSSLDLITSFETTDFAIGLYFDLWGNLGIVNTFITEGGSDIIYYYDTDGNYLNHIDNLPLLMLNSWSVLAGGSYIQGDVYFVGDLGTVTPAVPSYTIDHGIDMSNTDPVRLLSFTIGTDDSYILVMGDNAMAFFKEVD